jgi:hypothetical protein
LVHRYRNDTRTGGAKRLQSAGLARVFYPDWIAWGEKETADEIEGVLRA